MRVNPWFIAGLGLISATADPQVGSEVCDSAQMVVRSYANLGLTLEVGLSADLSASQGGASHLAAMHTSLGVGGLAGAAPRITVGGAAGDLVNDVGGRLGKVDALGSKLTKRAEGGY